MERINKRREEHFYNLEYLKNETKDLIDFVKENKNRKITNKKYLFRFKLVSFFLASSQLFGIVLVNEETKKLDNPIIIQEIEDNNSITETDINNIPTTPHELNRNEKDYNDLENKLISERDNISIGNIVDNNEIIDKYSEIFEFDSEKIREIILPILEDDGLSVDRDNRRIILETFIDIYFNTSSYGFTRNELRSNIDFETELTPEEQIVLFSDIFEVNPYDVLGIMTVEWGHPYNRNPNTNCIFGWSGTNNTPNKTVSMIISIAGLSNNYGLTREHNSDTIINMSTTYCPPNYAYWRSVVLEVSNNAMENGIFYDYPEEERENFIFNNDAYNEYINNNYSISRKINNKTHIRGTYGK